MKKLLIFGSIIVAAGCASSTDSESQPIENVDSVSEPLTQ